MEIYKTYFIAPLDFENGGYVASNLKRLLIEKGVKQQVIRKVVVGCYEAEINIVIHSYGGVCTCYTKGNYLTMVFHDHGPGIPNIEEAMTPGFTTAKDEAIRNGFGAGMGLVNIRSISDDFYINSSPEGTTLKIVVKIGEDNEIK